VKKTWSKANEMGWAVEHGAKWQFKSTAQARRQDRVIGSGSCRAILYIMMAIFIIAGHASPLHSRAKQNRLIY
jgi:hypothetical protein